MNSETLYLKTNIEKWDLQEKQYSMKHQKKRDLQSFANKLTEKILDPCNAKGYYNSYLKIKKTHTHTKTLIKISKTENISQVGSDKSSNNSFYSETKQKWNFLNEKNGKITKRAHAFKGYASSYNVEILNFFNPELQLKILNLQLKIN